MVGGAPSPDRAHRFRFRVPSSLTGAEIARLVPPAVGEPAARGLAQAGGSLMAGRRHQVERNLRRVHGPGFGDAELRRAVTATFDSYGRYFYELFRLPTYEPQWIRDH